MTSPIPNIKGSQDQNPEAQYLQNIQNEIQEIQADEQALTDNADAIENLLKQIGQAESQIQPNPYPSGGSGWQHASAVSQWEKIHNQNNALRNEISGYKNQIASLKGQLMTAEQDIAILVPGITVETTTLNEVLGLNSSNSSDAAAIIAALEEKNKDGSTTFVGDLIVQQILLSMKDEVNEQTRDLKMRSGLLTQGQLEQDYLNNMEDATNASLALDPISQIITSVVTQLGDAINAAMKDKNNLTTAESIFKWTGLFSRQDDQTLIKNDKDALNMLDQLGRDLSMLVGTLETEATFGQVNNMMNQLISKMKKIMNEKIPFAQKLNSVLSLMVQALAIFNMLQQDAENQKMENEKKMAAANQTQAKQTIENVITNQKILEHSEKQEKTIKIVQTISSVIMLAASFVAGSVFFAVFMTIMTGLDLSGDMSKWTNELAKKIGSKCGADAIMAIGEMAVGGAGCAIEAGMKASMSEMIEDTTEAVINASKESIEKGAKDAISATPGAAIEQSVVEQSITVVAKESAKMTGSFIRDEFFKLSLPALIERQVAGKGMKVTIEQAIKEAVTNAIKNSTKLAEEVASGKMVSESAMAEVTVPAASEAIAKASTKTAEDATKVLQPVKSAFSKEGVRAVLSNVMVQRVIFTLIYGLATTNILGDAAKKGKSVEKILANVTQALMEIIAMIGAMGSSSLATGKNGISAMLQKLQIGAQTGAQGAQAATEFEVAGSLKTQAEATQEVREEKTVQALLTSVLTEIQKAMTQGQTEALTEWENEMKSLNSLSMHLQDAVSAGIKVLMEQAV